LPVLERDFQMIQFPGNGHDISTEGSSETLNSI